MPCTDSTQSILTNLPDEGAKLREGAKFRVETDASDVATGVMLSQSIDGSEWHPVAFQLKMLGEHEANYSTYNKELLAIVRAIQEW